MRVGRGRKSGKDLPLGVYLVGGRYYVRPCNEAMRRVFAIAYPGKKSAALGADKAKMREQWVKLFVVDDPTEKVAAGTCGELIARYERDYLPARNASSKDDETRYCNTLKREFGARLYAKNEVDASTGKFVRSMDITQYLRREEKRAVYNKKGTLLTAGRASASNKEIQFFSKLFGLAKTDWGYTEYNPCLGVKQNDEPPRSTYHDDDAFMSVYKLATPIMQCMMDLAQMHGARRGMLIKANLDCIRTDGLLLPLNKKKPSDPQRYQLIKWTDKEGNDTGLREVIDRVLELRAKTRGGQKDGAGQVLELSRPLFLNRKGQRFSESGFNSLWQRARKRGGFTVAHTFHFHDIKAKSVSDSPNIVDAMERGGHADMKTTRQVYRRKPTDVIPLPRVSKKAS